VTIDGERYDVPTGSPILVPRGTRRRLVAGDGGVRYPSVHGRRGPLQIQPLT
jgi:hypothetical protein